jgi:hypothetical protein
MQFMQKALNGTKAECSSQFPFSRFFRKIVYTGLTKLTAFPFSFPKVEAEA